MKKVYAAMFMFAVLALAGCSIKIQKPASDMTGAVEEITGTTAVVTDEVSSGSAMEEFTGEIDSGTVPVVTGSETVDVNSGVSAEVNTLIEERNDQPKDDTKLTEEDIDLMQQIIDKVQDLGK